MPRTRWTISAMVAGGALMALAAAPAPVAAAGSVKSSVSLSAPSSGVYGSAIRLTGKLWRTGTSTPLPNATVWLQRSVHAKGRYGNLRSARTASNGTFAFSVTQSSAYDYRVTYGGSATYTKAVSPTRYPVTNRQVLFDSIATTSWETGALRVTGRAVPAPPNGTAVTLQLYSGGKWVNLASGRTTSGKVTINAARPGSVASYRLVTGARYPYGAGSSAARSFAHYKWRGAFVKPISSVFLYSYGGFSIAPQSEDPTRSTGSFDMYGSGYAVVSPDMSGCQRAWSSSLVSRGPVVTIGMDASPSPNRTQGSIAPGQGELVLNLDIRGGNRMRYTLDQLSGGDGFTVRTRIRLLCSN